MAATVTITDAARRGAYDAAGTLLYGLRLREQGSLIFMPGAPAAVAPAGYAQIAGIALAGIAIYAAYNAYVEAAAIDAAARVDQTRIQEAERARVIREQTRIIEDGNTQRVAAQLQAKLAAMAQRLAFAKETGRLLPESSIETAPLSVQAQQTLYQWQADQKTSSSSLGLYGAAVAAGGLLAVGGMAAYEKRDDLSAAYGSWQERRRGPAT